MHIFFFGEKCNFKILLCAYSIATAEIQECNCTTNQQIVFLVLFCFFDIWTKNVFLFINTSNLTILALNCFFSLSPFYHRSPIKANFPRFFLLNSWISIMTYMKTFFKDNIFRFLWSTSQIYTFMYGIEGLIF